MAAIILTVMCLSMQIGSFRAAGLEVARVYNLWFTDPLICYFVVGQTVGDKSWGTVSFRPEWPAVLPAVALILYLMAMRAIRADERLVRSMDRIR